MSSSQPTVDPGVIPVDVVTAALRAAAGDRRRALHRWEATPIQTDGMSGGRLYRILVHDVPRAGPRATAFVAKHWSSAAWTSILSGARRSREALAWKAGLLRPDRLGRGFGTPIVHAREAASEAWILMRDITAEFATCNASSREPACVRIMLDRIAGFHTASLKRRPPPFLRRRLYRQESRVRFLAPSHAAWLGSPGPEYHDHWHGCGRGFRACTSRPAMRSSG